MFVEMGTGTFPTKRHFGPGSAFSGIDVQGVLKTVGEQITIFVK